MTGLVIGMAMLVAVGGAPPVIATAEATTRMASSAERMAEPPARLKLPVDLVLVEEQPQPLWRAETARKARATSAAPSSTAAKVIGVVVGGIAGFFAGGITGAYLAQDKNADDDGISALRGVVIGAPIGAAVGALIGYQIGK